MQDRDLSPRWRIALFGLGIVGLACGVLGGLWRIGWNIPLPDTQPASFHGALTVAAFFGSVIGLERAVAYGRRSGYLGPLCAAGGGCATALGAPHLFSAGLLLAGSVVLAAVTFAIHRRQAAPQLRVSLIGAFCGVAGNLLWLAGLPASVVVGTWTGFLVLTLSGERLEHSHLLRPSTMALKLQATLAAVFVAGAATLPFDWRTGTTLLGAAMIGFALWLLAHDVARRNLRHHGSMRFEAVCLVGGYVWLGVGGLLLPFAAEAGPIYDAALHAVFLGFVVALTMANARDVWHGIWGRTVPFAPIFYTHIWLLNATLLLRLAGDLGQRADWRVWGGMGNAIAIALFLALTLDGLVRGRKAETD